VIVFLVLQPDGTLAPQVAKPTRPANRMNDPAHGFYTVTPAGSGGLRKTRRLVRADSTPQAWRRVLLVLSDPNQQDLGVAPWTTDGRVV
jgi:hypothetical protein